MARTYRSVRWARERREAERLATGRSGPGALSARERRTEERLASAAVYGRCAGPCRCVVEPDGECAAGWPALASVYTGAAVRRPGGGSRVK